MLSGGNRLGYELIKAFPSGHGLNSCLFVEIGAYPDDELPTVSLTSRGRRELFLVGKQFTNMFLHKPAKSAVYFCLVRTMAATKK